MILSNIIFSKENTIGYELNHTKNKYIKSVAVDCKAAQCNFEPSALQTLKNPAKYSRTEGTSASLRSNEVDGNDKRYRAEKAEEN